MAVTSSSCACSLVTWEDVADHMTNSQDHMDKLQSEPIQRLLNSDDTDMRSWAKKFDLTRSESAKVTFDLTESFVREALVKVDRSILHQKCDNDPRHCRCRTCWCGW